MSSRAFDIATILFALKRLESNLDIKEWQASEHDQAKIFNWLKQHGGILDSITGLTALASADFQELNRFLTDRGFSPVFKPFHTARDLGVVAIIDKMIKWLNGPAKKTVIHARDGKLELPGFELPGEGVNIYQVDGDGYRDSYLLELLTKSRDTLWLFVHPNLKISQLGLVDLSIDVMSKPRQIASVAGREIPGFGALTKPAFSGAEVPMVDFDVNPSLDFLLGAMATTKKNDPYQVKQACQQFKMRMDRHGARVKAATSMGMMLTCCIDATPPPFIVDRPFYGWWMQDGIKLPMAAFFVDYDSMKRPDGNLTDL